MVLIVFGVLFLVMTLIVGVFTKKEKDIENPNCKEEVTDVKNNRKLYKWFIIVFSLMIIVGLIIELSKL